MKLLDKTHTVTILLSVVVCISIICITIVCTTHLGDMNCTSDNDIKAFDLNELNNTIGFDFVNNATFLGARMGYEDRMSHLYGNIILGIIEDFYELYDDSIIEKCNAHRFASDNQDLYCKSVMNEFGLNIDNVHYCGYYLCGAFSDLGALNYMTTTTVYLYIYDNDDNNNMNMLFFVVLPNSCCTVK